MSNPYKKIRKNKFDLTHLMSDMRFDPRGLDKTSRDWTYPPDEEKTPQRFCGNAMIQQLDTTITCNEHNPFLGSLQ